MKITKITWPTGCGKTFIANCIQSHLQTECRTILWINVYDIIENGLIFNTMIIEDFKKCSKSTYDDIIQKLKDRWVEFLILISE